MNGSWPMIGPENWQPIVLGQVIEHPALAIFFVGVGLGLVLEWVIRYVMKLRAPRLYFGEPDVRFYDVGSRGQDTRENWCVASVFLHNDPQLKTSDNVSKAMLATATCSFYDLSGKQILDDKFSRWADNIQPNQPDASSNISNRKRRDVEPNDEPNLINIIMKQPDECECYALTFESWPNIGERPRNLLITKRSIIVKLVIKPSNARAYSNRFIIRHKGQDSCLQIERYPTIFQWRTGRCHAENT